MSIATIIGFIAAGCTTFSALPQLVKTIKTRRTADLSLYMYSLMSVGVFLWLIYGIMVVDWPLILANGISFIFVTTILIFKFVFK